MGFIFPDKDVRASIPQPSSDLGILRLLYQEDKKWYLITELIPTAAIFNLSHAQAGKPDPEAKTNITAENFT